MTDVATGAARDEDEGDDEPGAEPGAAPQAALQLPDPLPVPGSWHGRGACRGYDPEVFFEDELEDLAKTICFQDCPVRQDCLDYAVEARVPHGVWGGLNLKERENIRHREKKRRWRAARREAGLPPK